MDKMKAWIIGAIIFVVVVFVICWSFFIGRKPDIPEMYDKDFGKPVVWGMDNIIIIGTCSISANGIADFSDDYGINYGRGTFFEKTFVYWSEAERELVQLGKDGTKRVIPGIQIPALQKVHDIVPIRNGLIINTDKYILDNKGAKKDYFPSSSYRIDMKSGNCTLIDDAISARGNSTSDTIAVMTHDGEFKIIDTSGKISSVPNIRTNITFRLTWDFDPSHNLLVVLDGNDWLNLRVFRTTGEILWQKRNDHYGHEVVIQPSNGELWVAVDSKRSWNLAWQIDVYNLDGVYRGMRFVHIGTSVSRPLMPAEEWMKDILAIAEREK